MRPPPEVLTVEFEVSGKDADALEVAALSHLDAFHPGREWRYRIDATPEVMGPEGPITWVGTVAAEVTR
jgi:hypothetical protein